MKQKRRHFVRHITSALLLGSCLFFFLGCDSTSTLSSLSSSPSPVSPSPSHAPVRGSFVGEVTAVDDTQTPEVRYESDLFIGLVSNGTHIFACLTDGTPDRAKVFYWYSGEISNGVADLVSTTFDPGVSYGPAQSIHVILSSDTITGTLQISQELDASHVFPYQYPLVFHASLVSAGAKAGVYRAQPTLEHESYTAGWVVLPDGQQRGASATLVNKDSYSVMMRVLPVLPGATSVMAFTHQDHPVPLEHVQPTSSFQLM